MQTFDLDGILEEIKYFLLEASLAGKNTYLWKRMEMKRQKF